jgi:hypothetical protein
LFNYVDKSSLLISIAFKWLNMCLHLYLLVKINALKIRQYKCFLSVCITFRTGQRPLIFVTTRNTLPFCQSYKWKNWQAVMPMSVCVVYWQMHWKIVSHDNLKQFSKTLDHVLMYIFIDKCVFRVSNIQAVSNTL